MGSLPSDFAISLRARPSSKTDANLPSVIERINIERGGFQNITEESLRQEIAEAELDNEDGDENGTSDEEEEEPDRMKELMTSREAMLGQIEYTHPSPQNIQLLTELQSSPPISNVRFRLCLPPFIERYAYASKSIDLAISSRVGSNGHAGCRQTPCP
jgi:Subunit 17 of Mediator complex